MSNAFSKSLFIESVLDYYDGPILFSALDAVGTRYLCTFLETTDAGTEYLCAPLSKGKLNAFLKGSIDLRSIFVESETDEYYVLLTNRSEDQDLKADPIDIKVINESLLPASDYFLEQYEEIEELSLGRTFIEASLDVPEARHDTVIDAYTLSGLLRSVQDAIKYGYKKEISNLSQISRKLVSGPDFYSTEVFAFATASFTVKLRSSAKTLLGENEFDRAVLRIAEIIRLSENTDEALLFLRKNRGHFVAAIRRLISIPIERKCALGFGCRTIGKKAVTRYKMSYDEALKLQTALSSENQIADETVELIGVFTAVNVNHVPPDWTFTTDSGDVRSGTIEENKTITLSGIVIKSARYSISCIERIYDSAYGEHIRLFLFDEPRPISD